MALDIDMAAATDILDFLCCPATRQTLRAAEPGELALANKEGVLNCAGRIIERPVTDGLVREDGAVLYPIWEDIPCLLIEEGIRLEVQSGSARMTREDAEESADAP
jgi:uncharacterized protein YbaR (Trm112 family)